MEFGNTDYTKALQGLGYGQKDWTGLSDEYKGLLGQAYNPETNDWTGDMNIGGAGSNNGNYMDMFGMGDGSGNFDLNSTMGTFKSGLGLFGGLQKMFGKDPGFELYKKGVNQNLRNAQRQSDNQVTAYNNEMSRGQSGRKNKMTAMV